MKKELVKFEMNGEKFTLFEIQTRTDGTRETSPAFLLHKDSDEFNDGDRISGGIAGLNEPETAEDAAQLVQLASWSKSFSNDGFRIDGNGYYIIVE